MQEPILKLQWERFKAHFNLNLSTATQLLLPYTNHPIDAMTILSEGCANSNYKITFKNQSQPIVLRIYMREARSLAVETHIHALMKNTLPLPKIIYSDSQCKLIPHPYALFEWNDGELMRNIILAGDEKSIAECAYEAGKYLSQLRNSFLPQGGFFDETLAIRPFLPEEEFQQFIFTLLSDEQVQAELGTTLIDSLRELTTTQIALFPPTESANLTHADYDPANMLVKQINGSWKISAILDWEFAFAGSYLLDMGIMLRYSHKLPQCYENQFIAGIEANGEALPMTWKKQCKLMDLLCLLQLIHYNPAAARPNLNQDVKSLIQYTVDHWDSF
jgi:aminoglycoside phosphotransferase (APT) family kinase protein